ncbi:MULTISPECIES: CDP-glycerol glycerophosphotransferase family protein [unclassified Bacillus (in: firmicutes)]|uniref:CDP-glycerol glycerophosphotransferase family protein n=1 Tax=unclassified Bacillus (in: firmicutes) TaxID=185979 RepID=UPI002889D208|nr:MULTISPECIES: CDP-glycerol glycerophosphotransferase family protein [unclassified Bacillus (in: firmicutes)]
MPKSDQIYINTWHGTPLKNMGFDISGNPSVSQNVVRNFLSADFTFSPNAHTTNIFTHSYKLSGLYKGEIIEEGYPRIDLTLNTNPGEYKDYLRTLGLKISDAKENIFICPDLEGGEPGQGG